MFANIDRPWAEGIFFFAVALCMNWCICFVVYKITINLEKNKDFRNWIKDGIEDGDKVFNFKDMVATIMMCFGTLFFWLVLDMFFGTLIFKSEHMQQIFAASSIGASLLGVGGYIKASGNNIMDRLTRKTEPEKRED